MIYTIKRGDVTVQINSLGAELYSVKKGESLATDLKIG